MSETPMSRAEAAATARAARTRGKHERWAAEMRAAGWVCVTPEASEGVMVPLRDLMRKIRAEQADV